MNVEEAALTSNVDGLDREQRRQLMQWYNFFRYVREHSGAKLIIIEDVTEHGLI